MKPARFSYRRAENARHAVRLAREAGDEARFLAGGQSLVPMMNFRIARPPVLVDLADCLDIASVHREGERLRIGAMVRQRDAEQNPMVRAASPLLQMALRHAGPVTVRNRATVGGSLANGYPLAQLPCAALCLGAELVALSAEGERTIQAEDFFQGAMSTALVPGELLCEVVLPCIGPGERQAFRETGNHAGGSAQAIACGWRRADGRLRIAVSGWDAAPRLVTREEGGLDAAPPLVRAVLDDLLEAL